METLQENNRFQKSHTHFTTASGRCRQISIVSSIFLFGLAAFVIITPTAAQVTFHNDGNSNSYSVKTPGVQTSFTRFFGGQRGANLLQTTTPTQQSQLLGQSSFYQPTQITTMQQQMQSSLIADPTTVQDQFQTLQYPTQPNTQYHQMQYQQPQFQQTSPYFTNQPLFQQNPHAQIQPQQPYQHSQYANQAAFPVQQYAQPLAQQGQVQQSQPQQAHPQQGQRLSSPRAAVAPPQSPVSNTNAQSAYQTYQQQQYAQQQYQQNVEQQQQLLRQLYQHPQTGQASYGHTQALQQEQPIFSTNEYAAYLQQQQLQAHKSQQQQIHEQLALARSLISPPPTGSMVYPNTTPMVNNTSVSARPTAVQYSPSDKVSHVKFSSGNLAYNF